MSEEINEVLEELFNFFEFDEGSEWPSIAVWSQGGFYVGPIPDELYDILTRLKEAQLEAGEPEDND